MSSYSEGQVHQLANALERAGFTPADITRLGQYKGLKYVREVIRGTHRIVNRDEAPSLSSFARTFVPIDMKPKISLKMPNFLAFFEEVKDGELAEELKLQRLLNWTHDEGIIRILGGKRRAEVSLADFYATLAQKEHEGDHEALIAYAKDCGGVLRAVQGGWCDNRWEIFCARTIEFLGHDCFQVLSRN